MKARIIVAAIALSLMMSGCATYEWTKQAERPGDWEREVAECEYQIDLVNAPSQGGYYNTMGGAIGTGLAAGIGDAIRKNNLMGRCMELKGWWKAKK